MDVRSAFSLNRTFGWLQCVGNESMDGDSLKNVQKREKRRR